jgi:hypothetical protein
MNENNYESFISCIRTVKPSDKDWMLTNGLIMTPRAGFEVTNECPREYKMIIRECIDNGWLKPVAYIYDRELMWEKLSHENN